MVAAAPPVMHGAPCSWVCSWCACRRWWSLEARVLAPTPRSCRQACVCHAPSGMLCLLKGGTLLQQRPSVLLRCPCGLTSPGENVRSLKCSIVGTFKGSEVRTFNRSTIHISNVPTFERFNVRMFPRLNARANLLDNHCEPTLQSFIMIKRSCCPAKRFCGNLFNQCIGINKI